MTEATRMQRSASTDRAMLGSVRQPSIEGESIANEQLASVQLRCKPAFYSGHSRNPLWRRRRRRGHNSRLGRRSRCRARQLTIANAASSDGQTHPKRPKTSEDCIFGAVHA
jgi:hypothetical protein